MLSTLYMCVEIPRNLSDTGNKRCLPALWCCISNVVRGTYKHCCGKKKKKLQQILKYTCPHHAGRTMCQKIRCFRSQTTAGNQTDKVPCWIRWCWLMKSATNRLNLLELLQKKKKKLSNSLKILAAESLRQKKTKKSNYFLHIFIVIFIPMSCIWYLFLTGTWYLSIIFPSMREGNSLSPVMCKPVYANIDH